MKQRERGDASFVLGLVLGIAIGAAVAMILSPGPGDQGGAAAGASVQKARQSLESTDAGSEERVKGAAEGQAS